MRLFSTLDDGTGFIPVEYILDAWMEEGIENSSEILQVPHCPACVYMLTRQRDRCESLEKMFGKTFFFPFFQTLNFDLDGKLSLSDLTTALESELLVTKNVIHRAALASFKAEIRHLL